MKRSRNYIRHIKLVLSFLALLTVFGCATKPQEEIERYRKMTPPQRKEEQLQLLRKINAAEFLLEYCKQNPQFCSLVPDWNKGEAPPPEFISKVVGFLRAIEETATEINNAQKKPTPSPSKKIKFSLSEGYERIEPIYTQTYVYEFTHMKSSGVPSSGPPQGVPIRESVEAPTAEELERLRIKLEGLMQALEEKFSTNLTDGDREKVILRVEQLLDRVANTKLGSLQLGVSETYENFARQVRDNYEKLSKMHIVNIRGGEIWQREERRRLEEARRKWQTLSDKERERKPSGKR